MTSPSATSGRLTPTGIGHGPNAHVQGKIGENSADGGTDARQAAATAPVSSTSAGLPSLKADHPHPPRLHATTIRPRPSVIPGSAPLVAARSGPGSPRTM